MVRILCGMLLEIANITYSVNSIQEGRLNVCKIINVQTNFYSIFYTRGSLGDDVGNRSLIRFSGVDKSLEFYNCNVKLLRTGFGQNSSNTNQANINGDLHTNYPEFYLNQEHVKNLFFHNNNNDLTHSIIAIDLNISDIKIKGIVEWDKDIIQPIGTRVLVNNKIYLKISSVLDKNIKEVYTRRR